MAGAAGGSMAGAAAPQTGFRCSSAACIAYLMLAHAVIFSGLPKLKPPLHPNNSTTAASTTTAHVSPMEELVQPHGYELQEHFVTTRDGFILRLFRIPGRRSGPAATCSNSTTSTTCSSSVSLGTQSTTMCSSKPCRHNGSSNTSNVPQRPVVFLQHALMDSSAGWLLLGPGRSLALQLADAGFDVWMGNARGNRYSRNHTTLQPDDPGFWAWSWQQQAEHDLPASIDHVLATTQQAKLVYIGYSQGTMTALAALSTQPKLAASISVALLLAPVAFTTGMTSPSFVLSSKLGLDAFGLRNGWMEWGSHQPYWANMCRHVPQLCLYFLTSFCGQNPSGNVAPDLIPSIFEHLPAGTSVQVMSHWAQGIRRKHTKYLYAYDYGTNCSSIKGRSSVSLQHHSSQLTSGSPAAEDQWSNAGANGSTTTSHFACNQQAYGQETPAVYNMSAISTPLALFSGGQDTISTLADVELLKQQLQAGVLLTHQHFPDYGHLDFELGSDAPDILYPTLLQLAQEFSSTDA